MSFSYTAPCAPGRPPLISDRLFRGTGLYLNFAGLVCLPPMLPGGENMLQKLFHGAVTVILNVGNDWKSSSQVTIRLPTADNGPMVHVPSDNSTV